MRPGTKALLAVFVLFAGSVLSVGLSGVAGAQEDHKRGDDSKTPPTTTTTAPTRPTEPPPKEDPQSCECPQGHVCLQPRSPDYCGIAPLTDEDLLEDMRQRGIQVSGGFGVAGAAAASAQAQSKPAAPTSVSVVRNTSGSLSVSWPAVDTANAYNVNYSDDNMISWSRAHTEDSGTSVTVSGTNDSLSYYIAVQAVNEHGNSVWKNSDVVPAPTCANSIATHGPDADGNPDAAANPPQGLIDDCVALLALKSTLAGTSTALSTWNLFTDMNAYRTEGGQKLYDLWGGWHFNPGWRGISGYYGRVHRVSRANQGLTGDGPGRTQGPDGAAVSQPGLQQPHRQDSLRVGRHRDPHGHLPLLEPADRVDPRRSRRPARVELADRGRQPPGGVDPHRTGQSVDLDTPRPG